MKTNENNSQLRECKMCGKDIPRAENYPAEHCWICLRETVEREYHRYYVRTSEGKWEEVHELAGLFTFSEANKPKIKEAMEKKRQILEAQTQERRMNEERYGK